MSKSLNGSLSNRPWSDADSSGLTTGGEAGLGKRSLLDKFSLLVLSKDLIHDHPDAWTDEQIEARSALLTQHICDVWPGPPADIRPDNPELATDVQQPGETGPRYALPRSEGGRASRRGDRLQTPKARSSDAEHHRQRGGRRGHAQSETQGLKPDEPG